MPWHAIQVPILRAAAKMAQASAPTRFLYRRRDERETPRSPARLPGEKPNRRVRRGDPLPVRLRPVPLLLARLTSGLPRFQAGAALAEQRFESVGCTGGIDPTAHVCLFFHHAFGERWSTKVVR
jgi:hypothetical protein